MSGYVTKEILQMMEELSLEPVETDIATLDKQSDGSHDDADAPIPGNTPMTEGKYKTRKTTYASIYINDKDYVNWVRTHIGNKSSKVMRQFKVYVAFRDEGKAARIQETARQQMGKKEKPMRAGSPKRAREHRSRGSMELDNLDEDSMEPWVAVDPEVTENALHGWKWFTVNVLASDKNQIKRMASCIKEPLGGDIPTDAEPSADDGSKDGQSQVLNLWCNLKQAASHVSMLFKKKQVEQCIEHVIQCCERVCKSSGMFLLQVPDPQTGNMFQQSRKYITNVRDTQVLEQACRGDHQHENREGETRIGEAKVRRKVCAGVETEPFVRAVLRVCKKERNRRGVEVLASEKLNNPRSDKELMETIRRCHVNLGHPSRERFLYMLRTAKAKDQAIECAKRLKCATCEARKEMPSHQVSKHRRAEGFNQQVCVDVFEVPIYQQKKLKCLSIVCEGTSMHICAPLWKGATAENIAKAYRKSWTRWAGVPIKLFSDGGSEFDKEFQNALDVQGTCTEKAAAEAPWQNGLCERNNQSWKLIFSKAFEECVPTSKQEVNQLIDQVNNSKNNMMKRHGYAPCQHVFGCSPRFPDSILNEDACVVSNSAYLHGDHDVVRAQAIRLAARRALVEADNEDKVRRAIEHRTRKERGPFSVGDLVYYYRKLVGNKGVWKGPGRIIGMLENRSRIWVCHGKKVLRCCPEQLRGLSEDQEAAFRLVPVEMLRRRQEHASPGAQTFADISGEGPPPDEEMDVRTEPENKRPRVQFSDSSRDDPLFPELFPGEQQEDGAESTVPGAGSVRTASQPPSRRPSTQVGSRRPSTSEGYGPAPRETRGSELRRDLMSTARPGTRAAGLSQQQIDDVVNQDMTLEQIQQLAAAGQVPVPGDDEGLQVERVQLEKDVFEASLLQVLEEHAKDIEVNLSEIRESDAFIAQHLRSAEIRERDLDPAEREELLGAKSKEWQKLLSTGAIKVISGPEAEILRRQIDPSRILKSRFVKTRRPHPKLPGKKELKCRWCVKGYLDPDAESLLRQAPTLSGDGLAMVLQMIASRGWDLEIADVEGAFLQGKPLERSAGPIYVEMPNEEVPGAAPGSLVQLIKCVYGLMDAPRQWYDSFMGTMEGLGMRRSKLDPCVLLWFDGDELGGICAVHVDDMVIAGNQKFHDTVLNKLREAYPFKRWRIGKGDFLGRYLEQDENKTITCSQKEYADKVEIININRDRRKQKDQPLTASELRQLRGVVGAASWLVGSTRSDIAAQTAILQQKLGAPTVQEMIDANKLVARIKDLSKVKIKYRPIPVDQVMFLAVSDASWSNTDDLKTQAGYMTMAVDREIRNEVWAKMSPLRWKSYKLERRTQSTLGAELMAIARAVAEANWMRSLWAEASHREYNLREDLKFRNLTPMMVATDNKPIYDHSQGDGIVVKDKRVAIDMLLLKSDLSDSNVVLRWLDTKQMVVDGMTKSNASIDYLLYVLRQGEFIVVRESKSLEWKAQQRRRKMGD
ncbi:RE1 [Symbiodinium sp. CCMP2592]|nr:RE1 [Symbiodinium sp. CCMP2592]